MSLGLLGGYGGSDTGSEISDYGSEGREGREGGGAEEGEGCETASRNMKEMLGDPGGLSTDEGAISVESSDYQVLKDGADSAPAATSYGLMSDGGGGGTVESESSGGSPVSDKVTVDSDEGGHDICEKTSPLPLPVLDGSHQLASSSSSSVFSNPYREAENARLAVLKQHVDLSQHPEPSEREKRRRGKWPKRRGRNRSSGDSRSGPGDSDDHRWNDRDSLVGQGGQRKHRSGVGESLQPPKKYLKIHQKIQSEERPWTTR